ncbi:hypothetical protein DSM104443_01752 [Usitatibacter rugosus]|uniref:Methyl-accepting chemotaxis protein n=1 Tax=Usitatibacter rugosus TaxID=2732067 RepID=A0A6M4GUK6_9PROT|nr:methyl-accepting chemotaxis protein [Usitatibacter rugosus]QJR10685.1 hypothetical protein DSM104443_01752 [Usitatibacter rugosus]
MEAFLRPAKSAFSRVPLPLAFTAVSVLFLMPAAFLAFSLGGAGLAALAGAQPVSAALAVLALLVAPYLLAGLYAWARDSLQVLAVGIDRLGSGDLSAIDADAHHGEIGHLVESLGQTKARLAGIVTRVRTGSDAILIAASEIASANADLSRRTEAQASTLEQTSASTEQIAATIARNAEGCKRADALATRTTAVAAQAAVDMRAVVQKMGELEEGARRSVEIIGVINKIAAQTNILAINAAVEAARAGDRGREFAVVAVEVRELAGRCAEAARQIRTLLDASAAGVKGGVALVDRVGKTMDEAAESVREVGVIVKDMAGALAEQTEGIDEINRAIVHLDEMTQQNAALVEEAAASGESFRGEAARLSALVDNFKTDRGEARGRAIGLVKRAVMHIGVAGPERAFNDFERKDGGFWDGELYVLVTDLEYKRRAHGANPSYRGQNVYETRDEAGKLYWREIVEMVRQRGTGWCDYTGTHPRTKKREPKSLYVERAGNFIVGVGIYKEAGL